MKSFKLYSLDVVDNDTSVEVPLEDGLILNKEDEHSTWLLEAYTDTPHGCLRRIQICPSMIISRIFPNKNGILLSKRSLLRRRTLLLIFKQKSAP